MEMVAAARLRRAEQRIDAPAPVRGRDPAHDAPGGRGGRQTMPAAADPPGARERADRRPPARHRRPRPRRRVQLADPARRAARGRRATRARAATLVCYASGRRGVSSLTFRGRELGGRLHRLHRPPGLRQRARDRRGPDGRLRRRQGRPRRDLLQRLHLAARRRRCAARRCCRCSRRRSSRRDRGRATDDERRHGQHALVEYEPDPEEILAAPRPRLRRDLDLPGAARVDRLRARRAHDRDAQRLRERRRADRGPDAAR